ncbi:uncharacterized protein LOC109524822 [Hippocampus comes]|uniref:uncharacterized protein LOC109524822 n=1 Tax=Hippocampus comes TaxID=109280 RepID=UPI00094E1A88|nr:PREDICTED: uncharacterized protein LOC109524822 [Hippocampus comes]
MSQAAMAADLLPGEQVEKIHRDGAHLPSLQTAELSSSSHPEHQNEDGVPIGRGYRRDLLTDDGAELCFEEVRAQVFRKGRQKRLDEKRQCLREERTQLELQVARMSSLLKRPAHQSPSFGILEDLASPPPQSCRTLEAELPATEDARLEGAASLPERAQPCGSPTRDQDVLPHARVSCGPPDEGAGSADLRGRLLEPCDIASWANFHQETRPLPDIGEHGSLWLGGEHYRTRFRLLPESDVLAYEGSQDNHSVIIKVDRRPLAWDFYMFSHLSGNCAAAAEPPLARCHQFQDGCVTVYVAPPSHVFSVDLVGVAQMLHLLLTKRRMVPVRDARGWTAEGFRHATPGAWTGSLWCDAFRSLLNADADSWEAVTSELSERLASFLR